LGTALISAKEEHGGFLAKIGAFLFVAIIPPLFYYIPIRCGFSLIVWSIYGPYLLISNQFK